MRPSTIFLTMIATNIVLFSLLMVHAHLQPAQAVAVRESSAELVRELKLTDLCLFTEARYTRNPAMADRHSPFQDHPLALEHFPSGSLVAPPAVIWKGP